jgi:hypothetical protein
MTKFKMFREKICFVCLRPVSYVPSSNNKTLNARLLARIITGCHLHVMEQAPIFFAKTRGEVTFHKTLAVLNSQVR